MCRLSGVYRIKRTKANGVIARDVLRDLILFQSLGNEDATGVGWVPSFGNYGVIKDGCGADAFFKNENTIKSYNNIKARAIIGHCRLKTQGVASENKNNHPIHTKTGIMAVHNGIVSNDKDIFTTYAIDRDAEVDSEAIPALVEYYVKQGMLTTEAIQEAIKKLRGSIATAMLFSFEPDNLYLIRRENQLHIAIDQTNNLIYFATDEAILTEILKPKKLLFGFFEVKNHNKVQIQAIPLGKGLKITPKGITTFTVENPPFVAQSFNKDNENIASENNPWCMKHHCLFLKSECKHKAKEDVIKFNLKEMARISKGGSWKNAGLIGIIPGSKVDKNSIEFDMTKPIKKPSDYSLMQLQARYDHLEGKEFKKPLTALEMQEIRRLDNALQDRRKQLYPPPPPPNEQNNYYLSRGGAEDY